MIEFGALLTAFGGGVFGAALGALPVFIFTGVAVIAGVALAASSGDPTLLATVAFGPFLGPHIAFAGGAAAAAYAARIGRMENGRDITKGLMGLNRPDVLLVGGLFGILGYLLNHAWLAMGWELWTDTIALTVVLSAVVARLAFGRTGLLSLPKGASLRPDEKANWLPFQEGPAMLLLIGLGAGLPAAYSALALGTEGGGEVLGFGVAAASLIFLQFGTTAPVTHHIALPAAVAALVGDSLLLGAAFGVGGAFAGEAWSRLVLIRGDTHIDPPAAAIATMILLLRVVQAAAFG